MGLPATCVSPRDIGFGHTRGFKHERNFGFGLKREDDEFTGWRERQWFDPGRGVCRERGCTPDR